MANEINGVPPKTLGSITDVNSNRRVSGEQPQSGASDQAAPEQRSDTVALTEGARLLARVEAELANASDVDVERVAALKESIASGTYQVDDNVVADKLLRSDSERN
ncbi:MAG: flagellar biosynthesis anti-sigma factor FlgM [Pseudomonadota bacterium]